jgi:hypothetical protein
VTDPSGAAIPSVTVRATRIETNVSREVHTTSEGVYTIPGLDPGRYNVTFTKDGFQTIHRTEIVLQVAEKLSMNVRLEVGSVTQEITVTGQQELISTATASRGLVFDPMHVQEIPLNGRQAYMLMRLSPGVMFTQRAFGAVGFSGTRGWDVNGAFVMNGGRTGSNQFLLNGAPISTEGTFNLAPNVEAVQEMKVMVNTYDAQYGRSGGGHVNTTLKSGTNDVHGSLFNFWRNRILDANALQNNALGEGRGFRNQHQFGGTVGLAARKNTDFLFFSFEGWREVVPFPSNVHVPPTEIRGGDFNFTPMGVPGPIRIFDPLTSQACGGAVACLPGGVFRRDPFPGNMIPASRIHPVGATVLGYYPAPNFQPQALVNNFTRPDNLGRFRYEQPMGRYDKVITERDRIYFLFTFQDGATFRNANGFDAPAMTGNMPGSVRRDMNFVVSYDKTLSPTRLFRAQASYNRFAQNLPDVSDPNFTIDRLGMNPLPTVGTFPTRLAPRFNLAGFAPLFGNNFMNDVSRQQANFQASISEVRGRHSIKYGIEIAQIMHHARNAARAGGEFDFGTLWSRQFWGIHQGVRDGSSVADLLLGNIGSGFINYNDTWFGRMPYTAAFIQDDWKVTRTLTLNLGLRYDVQFPVTEIHNRRNRGFDYASVHTNSPAILSRWREIAAATPGFPAAPDAIRGGLLFAGVGDQPRGIYNWDFTNLQPRIGFAWNFANKTVLRGGMGIFHRTDPRFGIMTGFNLNTLFINSLDAGRTHSSGGRLDGPYTLMNPFPDGLVRPFGSAHGIGTNFGASIGFDNPNRPIPRTRQWSLTLERELPWGMILEVSYVGSRTTQEARGIQIGDMSREHFDAVQDPGRVGFYQAAVSNPFFGMAQPGTFLNVNRMVPRRDLLRAFPGFTSVIDNVNPSGDSWFHSLQVRFEKRMLGDRSRTGGLTWVTAYTWSRMMENFIQDPFAHGWRPMRYQVTAEDRPHNFSMAAIWDIPIGKNRGYLNNMPKFADFLAGGWTANFNLIYQSGVPLGAWRSWEFLCGNPRLEGAARTETSWFFNNPAQFGQCWRMLRPFEYTQLPHRFHQLRSHTAPQFDFMISKRFQLNERWQVEFRGEAFNAFNTPLRGDPPSASPAAAAFGVLPVAQLNFPRNIQLGARIRF